MASFEVRVRRMYDKLIQIENIEKGYHLVRNATKHRKKIVHFEMFYLTNIMQIHSCLKEKKYQHSNYNVFLVKIPKYRIVMSEIISDKIINHMVSKQLLNVIEPRLIEVNVATRKDKGLEKGLDYVKKYIHHLKFKYDKIYVLKCDIKKYFYNIDHDILFQKLQKIILDEDFLKLIKNILDTTNNPWHNEEIKKIVQREKERIISMNLKDAKEKLEELDRIPLYVNGKGLPIGNMTSQIFAIFYLNDLDHFIKEQLKIKYYIRYMDDFILFHPDKDYLKHCLHAIEKELENVKLKLNGKTQILELNEGFNFLGYRFQLKGKKLLILINSQTKKRITKKLNRIVKENPKNKSSVLASYKGYLKHCSCKAYLHKHGWYQKERVRL